MALTDKLTAIASAIRAKTGKTGKLTLEQMATEIGSITTGGSGDGDGGGVISGSFTPTENMLNIEIDVGTPFTHFVLYTFDSIEGQSVKASKSFLIDLNLNKCNVVATNNSGTALSGPTDVTGIDEGTSIRFGVNNTRIILKENKITITTSSPNGSCLGYFLAGVTYIWYAW